MEDTSATTRESAKEVIRRILGAEQGQNTRAIPAPWKISSARITKAAGSRFREIPTRKKAQKAPRAFLIEPATYEDTREISTGSGKFRKNVGERAAIT